MVQTFEWGDWIVEYDLRDGARIGRLAYSGMELVTIRPETFTPAGAEYGLYETRPVYGYDDCFPSVEQCVYPGREWNIPDHGELCWLPWDLDIQNRRMIFSVESRELPVQFKRILEFDKSSLVWSFEVINSGEIALPFQNVMHPLMPLNDVTDILLPEFESVINEKGEALHFKNPGEIKDFLLNVNSGLFFMLFVQRANQGRMGWTLKDALQIWMDYPIDLFPTIGIWWNNSGYPDSNIHRRNECAFEPIPGRSSTLSDAYDDGLALLAEPGKPFTWKITWNVEIL